MIPSPISPYIFGTIRFYSVFMALGIFVGCYVSYILSKKYFTYFKNLINPEILLDLLPFVVVFGILGARVYYVLLNYKYFSQNINEIIMIQNGGISIHGAIIGGLLGGFIYSKIKKFKILPYADVISFGLILAQAIGRIGNYFNQEAFGTPYNGLLKLYVDESYRPFLYKNFSYFHPTFLYEIAWNLVVFLILFIFLKKNKNYKSGVIFFLYGILYSIGRFVIEGIRIDSALNVFSIPIAQIVSLLIIILCSTFIFFIYKGDAS